MLGSLSLLACEGDQGVSNAAQLDWNGSPPALAEGSPAPREGGACADDGEVLPCGKVIERFDDYVTCSEGYRTCEDGRWGACVGTRTTQRPAKAGAVGLRTLALGAPEQCPEGFDVCDPYCNRVVDSPDQITPDDPLTGLENFNRGTSGITPIATGVGNCTSLAIGISPETPLAGDKWVVTSLSPLAASPATTLKLTLTAAPAGCAPAPFETTWAVDKVDRATAGGSMSDTGTLTLAVPVAGTLRVTAFGKGLVSPALEIPVNVNVLHTTTAQVSPNTAATSTEISAFGSAASTPNTATWLYPYEGTYFPLGLPAPVLQYRYSTACGNGRSVKVSLRYPAGASAASAEFNYSMIVKEQNTVSVQAMGGTVANNLDPQAVIPQSAWQHFEQTARGRDAELIVQRLRHSYLNNYGTCTSGARLEPENRLGIHFVDGQLKGTVFYNSYTSPLGGNVGAVLEISPGATVPKVAVQQRNGAERRCTVCHTLSVDGSKLIANVDLRSLVSGGVQFNNTRRYDMTAANPSAAVLNTWTMQGSSEFPADGDNRGDRFTYGAPWLGGDFYMSYGGEPLNEGDHNWRSPYDWSKFYRLGSGALNPADNAINVGGWSNVSAVTPRFSPDGTKLAFGFWGRETSPATTLPCSSPSTSPCSSNKLRAENDGTRLAVVDFVSPSNTASNTGWRVENARDVTPGMTHKVAWPTFTPDGKAVAYQRVFRGSDALISGWSPSALNTVTGALAELWLSDVPANGNSAATPTRLLALNGLSPSCSATSTGCTTSYLPTAARTISPVPTNYHHNASFRVYTPDSCTSIFPSATATGVNDYQLNYLPSFNPTEAGGKRWVIFSSRRMYGNIAYGHPWDAEPGMSCEASRDTPSTKKLWVSAIDKEWTPGQDPSHPAFYLPGQELKAGNSNAYWVNAACTPEGGTCSTHDDCCGGAGDAPTTSCKVVSPSPLKKECTAVSACSAEGEECASTSQCCTGLTCPEGGGTCLNIPEPIFEPQTLAREYITECPHGTEVKWRFFEWQASLPPGTSIDFAVQTREKAEDADPYMPLVPLTVASANTSTPAGSWDRGAQTTEQALIAAGLSSRKHLLVTMTFNPDLLGSAAPTLQGWRQIYDCVPAH